MPFHVYLDHCNWEEIWPISLNNLAAQLHQHGINQLLVTWSKITPALSPFYLDIHSEVSEFIVVSAYLPFWSPLLNLYWWPISIPLLSHCCSFSCSCIFDHGSVSCSLEMPVTGFGLHWAVFCHLLLHSQMSVVLELCCIHHLLLSRAMDHPLLNPIAHPPFVFQRYFFQV